MVTGPCFLASRHACSNLERLPELTPRNLRPRAPARRTRSTAAIAPEESELTTVDVAPIRTEYFSAMVMASSSSSSTDADVRLVRSL